MSSNSYTTSIRVDQSPSKAFTAIQDFRSWWSENITGTTDKLNETFFYNYKDVHRCRLQLTEIIPDHKLVYTVLENEFNFTQDKKEWTGTKLVFTISAQNGQTRIDFTHEGLVPAYECYTICRDAWTSYIQGSLKSLIETGKGNPNPPEGGLNQELIEKWGLPKK